MRVTCSVRCGGGGARYVSDSVVDEGLGGFGVAATGGEGAREEAVRLYTINNGWFLKEEANLGSLEVGKFGDVVVLSDDYFNPVRVPDESIRKLHPVLTIVDGKVVYNLLDR